MAGPYGALRLGDNVFLDARVLAGSSNNEISPYLTYTDPFDSQRWLAAVRISGRWNWNRISVTPSAEYIHFSDRSSSYTDSNGIVIVSQRIAIDRLVFGPEFHASTTLRNGSIVDFRLATKGLWDITPLNMKSLSGTGSEEKRSEFHARLDLGVSVTTNFGVSAGVTVGMEGLGGDGFHSLSVTGKIKVPLD